MILSQATHGILKTSPSLTVANLENCFATFTVCFGPGNANYLAGVRLTKGDDGQVGWSGPVWTIERDGQKLSVPLYGGEIMVEITRMAANALERVKKEFGSSAWNTRYMIYKDHLEKE